MPHTMRYPSLCLLTLAVSTSLAAQELRGTRFTDVSRGYAISIPKRWSQVPTQADERWIGAQFQSNRTYTTKDDYPHKAMMRVIVFDHAAIKKLASKDRKKEVLNAGVPYRDYKDYVKRNLRGGGYFFDQERKEKVDGREVQVYRIKMEKLATVERRFYAWVYEGPEIDFAIEFEILAEHFDKNVALLDRSLRSFRFVERIGGGGDVAEDVDLDEWNTEKWSKLPAAKRRSLREKFEEQRTKKILARLPADWEVVKTPHFLILSHSTKSYTKRIATAAEVCRGWLEKRFGSLSDEYAMRGVIRICKDEAESDAYRKSSAGTYNWQDREIVDYKDADSGSSGGGYGRLFYDLYNDYIHDKDRVLYFDVPAWLDYAMMEMFADATIKGRKMVFKATRREKNRIRDLRKAKKLKTARELMHTTTDSWEEGMKAKLYMDDQLRHFLRFLEGPGRRTRLLRGRDFVLDYYKASMAVAREFRKKANAAKKTKKEAETEEEEERRAAERRSKVGAEKRKKILAAVNERVCNWTDAEWAALQQAYARYSK